MMSLKNDNRGISLVEVLVVVGILVILAGSTASAMGYIVRGNIKDAAKKVYSAIASNQTYSKAKAGEWTLNCVHDGSQFVLSSRCSLEASDYETTKLSNRVTAVMVKDSLAGAYENLASIEFNKNTGSVKAINGNPVAKAGYADIQLTIEGNVASLRLYYLTGEIEMY